MNHDREVDEQTLRAADEAITAGIEQCADAHVEKATEVAALMKHILAALKLAGVPLDCATADALHSLAEAISLIIHEADE